MVDLDGFKQGLRRMATGVAAVTVLQDEECYGHLATAAITVSMDPPTLLICVSDRTSTHDPIDASGAFCFNVLADGDAEVARRFGSSAERSRRFTDRQWDVLITGAPALVDCVASFDCRVVERLKGHGFTVFTGEVVAVELWSQRRAPLVYHDATYMRL